MLALTTEQFASFTVAATDGRGRPVALDTLSAVSSDETVVRVELDGVGGGRIISVAPGGPAQVVLTADVEPGEGVREAMAVIEEITVSLDPRTEARFLTASVGAPEDKPL